MKKETFLEYVNGRKVKQSCVKVVKKPKDNYSYYLNDLIHKFVSVKGLIKYIDFQCEINKDGGCKETGLSLQCCCYHCKDNVGYISLMFDQDIPFYARHFSSKTGFWRKGKGCVLPHHKRSTTCLTHNCNYSDKGYKHFSKGIYEVGNLLKTIRNSLLKECQKGA